MRDLLVTIILAVCPASSDGGTTPCMENIINCAVEKGTLTTRGSIKRCVEEYRYDEDEYDDYGYDDEL